MMNLLFEATVRDRERETQELVRRRRLLAGDGADQRLEQAAVAERATRRERRLDPSRLATR